MTTAPNISVVIPTHNRVTQVQAAIDSALSQSLAPTEIIVVDDASSDDTAAVLERVYATRIKFIRLVKNAGGATARNAGADAASGEFIAFLDSDDIWFHHKLERQYAAHKEGTRDGKDCFIYTRAELDFRILGQCASPLRPVMPGERIEEYIIIAKQEVQTSGFFLSRALFRQVRFSDGLRRHQDIDFVLRAQHIGACFCFVDETLYKRRKDKLQEHVGVIKDDGISYAWALSVKGLMTTKAYHRFILDRVVPVVFSRDFIFAARLILASALAGQPWFKTATHYLIRGLRSSRLASIISLRRRPR